jgi:iron complex transport system substrate-binding protein
LALCGLLGFTAGAGTEREPPERIISLAPSTTEILFALELGGRVVGVTRYCDYPSATAQIPKVGGYFDPNYEQLVALRPDLVILLTSHRDAKVELEKMRIRTLTTPHRGVDDVQEAIRLIGAACDRSKQAAALLAELSRRTRVVQRAVGGKQRPRVLVCIGRDTELGKLSGMYVAGRRGFYDEIIRMAGGVNACDDDQVAYPQVSAEGVIQMNPDVIIDLVSQIKPDSKPRAAIKRHWERLRVVKAVRAGQVHVVVGNHALRPGPRYVDFLEQLARVLHPDRFGRDSGDD